MQFHKIFDIFFLITTKKLLGVDDCVVSMTPQSYCTYDIAESEQVFVFQREWKNMAILELEKPSFEKLVRHT